MKKLILMIAIFLSIGQMNGQTKKQQEVIAERLVDLPANQIWQILGEDYGAIANSHPAIVSSKYTSGSLAGEKGAERLCYFNKKGSQMFHEKITEWNPEGMSFTQIIVDYKKFPIDKNNTIVTYSVEDLGPDRSRIKAHLKFRTKPAFMGSMAKGKFKAMLEDYFLAIEHHIKTGENVTVDNFKSIKKLYKS